MMDSSWGVIISFEEADECTPGILVTRFVPLLHNRPSQQLSQLSTPLGACLPPFIFFRLLPLLSFSFSFSLDLTMISKHVSFLLFIPFDHSISSSLFSSPPLSSVTFNSNPPVPSLLIMILSTSLLPLTSISLLLYLLHRLSSFLRIFSLHISSISLASRVFFTIISLLLFFTFRFFHILRFFYFSYAYISTQESGGPRAPVP